MGQLRVWGLAALCTLILACSDSSDRRPNMPDPEPPEPPAVTDLDATGVYQGLIATEDGDVALLRVTLARDGGTAVAIETGDGEEADILLWGSTEEAAGELDFNGRDSRDGSEVALTWTVDEGVLRGVIHLTGLNGEAMAPLADNTTAGDPPTGSFARQDSLDGFTRLTLAEDGTVTLEAPCAGSGELSAPDPAVNVYRLTVDSDCLQWEALVSRDSLDGAAGLLSVTGDAGLTTRLYQP